jgi:hypothetical protein
MRFNITVDFRAVLNVVGENTTASARNRTLYLIFTKELLRIALRLCRRKNEYGL